MKVVKKFLAGLLAATLTVSTPITSLATQTHVDLSDSAGGNSTAGSVVGRGGDFSANRTDDRSSGKIGIRLSLVNRLNPSEVVSVDDAGTPQVVDILYVTKDQFNEQTGGGYYSKLFKDFKFTSVKTQPLMSEAKNPEQVIKTVFRTEAEDYLGEQLKPWLIHQNDRFTSLGTDFVEWCTTNSYGQPVISTGGSAGAGGGLLFTVSVGGYAIPVQREASKDAEGVTTVYTVGSTASGKYLTSESYVEGGRMDDVVLYSEQLEADYIMSRYDKLTAAGVSHDEALNEVALTFVSAASVVGGYEDMEHAGTFGIQGERKGTDSSISVAQALRALPTIPGIGQSLSTTVHGLLASLDKDAAEPYQDANGQGIPNSEVQVTNSDTSTNTDTAATDTATDTTGTEGDGMVSGTASGAGSTEELATRYARDPNKSRIEQILMMWDDTTNTPVFQTQSMVEARKNGEVLTLANCEEDWVLLVEPLVWFTVYPNGSTAYQVHTKVYGTITNLAQAFTDPSVPAHLYSLTDYADKRHLNHASINEAVWWALKIGDGGFSFNAEDPESPGFYQPTHEQAYRSFKSLNDGNSIPTTVPALMEVQALYKEGHTESMTRTNVTEGFGVNIYWKGMLNPPTDIPDLTSDPDPDPNPEKKPIKVAKWYTINYFDDKGNLEAQKVVNVKTGNIGTELAIVNEPSVDYDGIWEVVEWTTGKDPTAVPADGDTSTTFEEYASKAPGTKGGTQPTIIDLTDSEEKIVYVKLVYRVVAETEPPAVTIVKIKEPANGSTPIIEKTGLPEGSTIYEAGEEDWIYQEDYQTPAEEVPVTSWSDVPTTGGTSGTNPSIPVQAFPG